MAAPKRSDRPDRPHAKRRAAPAASQPPGGGKRRDKAPRRRPPPEQPPPAAELQAAETPTAVPMQAGAALTPDDVAALSEGFRSITRVVEEVGRTLEAQSQRTNRLLERFEGIAGTLQLLPHAAERELEALDAIQRTVDQQGSHMQQAAQGVAGLERQLIRSVPEVLRSVQESQEGSRRLFTEALGAIPARLAYLGVQAEERVQERLESTERRRRGWLVLGVATLVLAIAGMGAAMLLGIQHIAGSHVAGGYAVEQTVTGEAGAPPRPAPDASPPGTPATATVDRLRTSASEGATAGAAHGTSGPFEDLRGAAPPPPRGGR